MQDSMVDYTQYLDSQGVIGVQTVHEALEDSRCLQALTGSLLDTLQSKYDELQQQMPSSEDNVASDKDVTRRNIENLIFSLQNIRKDVDANVETFNNPRSKTFFQSNIEQLTAIYQLLFILPSLRPFIPDKCPTESVFDEQPGAMLVSNDVRYESDDSLDMKDAKPACFDRVPRSLSSLPPSIQAKSEVRTAVPMSVRC